MHISIKTLPVMPNASLAVKGTPRNAAFSSEYLSGISDNDKISSTLAASSRALLYLNKN